MRRIAGLTALAVMAGISGCAPDGIHQPSQSPSASPTVPALTGTDLELAIIDALSKTHEGYYGAAMQRDGSVEVTISDPSGSVTDQELAELQQAAERVAGSREVRITVEHDGPPTPAD